MRCRHPVRELELEGLFLRQRRRHTGGEQQRQKRSSHGHSLPWWMEPGFEAPVSLVNMLYRLRDFSSRSRGAATASHKVHSRDVTPEFSCNGAAKTIVSPQR